MSVKATREAWTTLGLDATTRLVLLAYADHACEVCGLCWPGVRHLSLKTSLGETAISSATKRLADAGHLVPVGYQRGGRGRSAEWVVLPKDTELSTAPCGKCLANQQKRP